VIDVVDNVRDCQIGSRDARGAAGGRNMDLFSMIVLENTLELAAEAMASADWVSEDVKVIRGYLNLLDTDPGNAPEYSEKLRVAILDLIQIANQNHQFLISGRLDKIVRSLPPVEKHAS